jgi:hypothetical protein
MTSPKSPQEIAQEIFDRINHWVEMDLRHYEPGGDTTVPIGWIAQALIEAKEGMISLADAAIAKDKAVKEEREECAKIALEYRYRDPGGVTAEDIAARIRSGE